MCNVQPKRQETLCQRRYEIAFLLFNPNNKGAKEKLLHAAPLKAPKIALS